MIGYSWRGSDSYTPLAGGYRGAGKPYLLYIDRRGQLTGFDFFDTAANRNILITGGSGGGKSFLMNYLVSSYYSCGHRVRILDVGGSYEKLSYIVGGTYIYPLQDRIIINFFETLVLPSFDMQKEEEKDKKEEKEGILAMLTSIIATMVYCRTGAKATEAERVLIELAIIESYKTKKNQTTIDDIANFLNQIFYFYKERGNGETGDFILKKHEKSIQTAQFLSESLMKFTTRGEYGKYFNGKTNISLDNQLVVTELNHLPDDLKKVLVLAMTSIISDEVYGGNNHPTLIFLDEAWQTLSENPAVANFVEGLYRKVRKHNGSVGIVTQSVSDFEPNNGKLKHLAVLKTQSSFHFIIIDKDFITSCETGVINDVNQFEQKFYYSRMPDPKSIQYRYSEIFIKGDTISAVVRLMVDQYTYMMNTSAADEKDYIVHLTEKYMAEGADRRTALSKAIDDCDTLASKLGSIGAFSAFCAREAVSIRQAKGAVAQS